MNNNLSPAKRALLEKWRQGQMGSNSFNIGRRPPESPVSISLPQRRQLFLELLSPGSAINNLSVFLEFNGKLNVDVLQQSANKIIARHDILRTYFSFENGALNSKVLKEAFIILPIQDLRNVNYGEQLTKARQLAEREVLQPFDLAHAPLIRLKLYVLSEEKYLLLVIVHHSISDGWSLGVFLTELMMFYNKIINGKFDPLPELPVQYADFAHWQINEKVEIALQSSLSYWTQKLDGDLPLLDLPTNHQRGLRKSFSGGTHRFIIPNDLIESLEKLSRESDATLFMTLLTAYYVLLHRYSGQDEILIGSPIANRDQPELEKMIGVFINTLALRINFSGDPGFREMLIKIREVCLEAYAHQDTPFEKLVEALKPNRDLSRTPVFQVVFNLQNSPMPELKIPGIEMKFLELDRGVSQFDLTLMISKLEGRYHATVEYSDELFDAATINRMFQSYQLILADITANPECPISEFRVISKEEQYHLIYKLNQTQIDFPRKKFLHQLFESQAKQKPNLTALIYDHVSITYNDLNRRANMLARHLKKLGVNKGTRVGILMERSSQVVEALLGILKAGGIYIPINTSFPEERIQFILSDANVKVLLTNVNSTPANIQNIHVVNLNNEELTANDYSNLETSLSSDDLAYIIYTSGSTGNPKGVMVRHSSLMNFLWSMCRRPGIMEEDILLAVTPISFDIAALELFLPLMVGATIVIAGKEITTNPIMISEAIKSHHVNIMQATPATWQLLIDAGWKGNDELKALCGGETLTRKLADQLLDRVGSLWNMYGPTETTIWSSIKKIQKGNDPITIGQPIGNTQLYILDRYLQLVPIGVIGELYIGGKGLAQGYLNNDILTNKKFITNHLSYENGERLYRTGDEARYLPDHSIEILGRTDDQVKINGHRIELGEIESVLLQHPSVQEAIVVINMVNNCKKQIVAYYVLKQKAYSNEIELKKFIGKKLPVYMLPAFFVCMDRLPVTLNGKVDRKSLPKPESIHQPSGYEAPRSKEEKILVSIWQDILGVSQVSINDNFFDLGGASMQSLQIVAKANMYGLHISVENIFEYQTIAELVTSLNGNHNNG